MRDAELSDTIRTMRKSLPYILTALVAAGIGYGMISAFPGSHLTSPICTGKYTLVSPDFNCDEYSESTSILRGLQAQLLSDVATFKRAGDATQISVWVRDLTTLQWVGIDQKILYAPASLFKLPAMIALYKYAEVQPDVLKQTVVFQSSTFIPDIDKVEPANRMTVGAEYTLEQIIDRMIRYSDNEAYEIVVNRISNDFLADVYSDLGFSVVANSSVDDNIVTARSYANIFRSLYQGSYLTPEYSQKALELLSSAEYHDAARAAIPQNITVAHKYGERQIVNPDGTVGEVKFHDCGIVYLPQSPYIFCIMTSGKDKEHLNMVISSISKRIYESFSHKN